MMPYKNPQAEVKRWYGLYVQLGLVTSLLVTIAAFRLPLRPAREYTVTVHETEIVNLEEIEHTLQETPPPPPPAALPPPVEVSDEAIIEDVLVPSIELNYEDRIAAPPPPPPPAPVAQAPPPPELPPEPENEIFEVVEQMPELIGGIASLQIDYPEIERLAGIEGRVFVQFVVNTDGSVSDVVVVRGVSPGLDAAAVEAARSARFLPGRQRGRAVKVRFTLPVTFELRRS